MSLQLPDINSADFADEQFISEFIQTLAPNFLVKPGMDMEAQQEFDNFKKKLIFKIHQEGTSSGKKTTRLESLKSMIQKAPKDKQLALIYVLLLMGVWDGLEDQLGDEVIEPMNNHDIVHFFNWVQSQMVGADQDLMDQIQLECAHATAISSHGISCEQITDIKGVVIYQDGDFVILHSDEGQIVAIDRLSIDDAGLFRGAYVYAQLQVEGEFKGQFKLFEPGLVIER